MHACVCVYVSVRFMLIINLLSACRDRSDNERPSAVKPNRGGGERVKGLRVKVCGGKRSHT